MGDMDIGDMFHNFMLHEKVQVLAGIDLTTFYPAELTGEVQVLWERWMTSAMGLRSSPYNTIQGVLFAEEVIRGDPRVADNVFRWDEVRLNLPWSHSYQPHVAWVSKIRHEDGRVACDFITYVDDTRSFGNSWYEARQASRTVASRLNWLGIQDAARKRRDPCKDPGLWAGSVIHVLEEGVISVSITQERWEKTVSIISWIREAMEMDNVIEFKTLEKYIPGLCVVDLPSNDGLFKRDPPNSGFMETWTSGRWMEALSQREMEAIGDGKDPVELPSDPRAPSFVRWVPRLRGDRSSVFVHQNSSTTQVSCSTSGEFHRGVFF
jgi:hypothetical protein